MAPTYAGCYKDLIPSYKTNGTTSIDWSTNMTNYACFYFCSQNGHKVSATQAGRKCFCTSLLGNYFRESSSSCVYACSGYSGSNASNLLDFCGGLSSSSVYFLTCISLNNFKLVFLPFFIDSKLNNLDCYLKKKRRFNRLVFANKRCGIFELECLDKIYFA